MQKRSDDRLVAYLDGELEAAEQREVAGWLDSDPAARRQLAALAESAELVRHAFDEVLHEPLPERLIAAARGEAGAVGIRPRILPFKRRLGGERPAPRRRWRLGLPVAASLVGLLVGGAVTIASMIALTGASPVPPARQRTSRGDRVSTAMVPAGAPSSSGSPGRT